MRSYSWNCLGVFASFCLVTFSTAGCGGGGSGDGQVAKNAPAPANRPAEKALAPPNAVPSAGGGSVTGRITFDGEAPLPSKLDINKDVEVCGKTEKFLEAFEVGEGGELGNAVVYLKGVPNAASAPIPAQNPLIDQTECRYEPHVILVPAGATIDFRNSDGILHNLHTYGKVNPPFNAAQPKFKKVIKKKIDEPEFIRLSCDVHSWMEAWIVVHDHPYYALTDTSGQFRIDGVPPGDYEIAVWHERLGEKSGRVTVKAGESARFEASLAAS